VGSNPTPSATYPHIFHCFNSLAPECGFTSTSSPTLSRSNKTSGRRDVAGQSGTKTGDLAVVCPSDPAEQLRKAAVLWHPPPANLSTLPHTPTPRTRPAVHLDPSARALMLQGPYAVVGRTFTRLTHRNRPASPATPMRTAAASSQAHLPWRRGPASRSRQGSPHHRSGCDQTAPPTAASSRRRSP
jgi:hypothetical protein